LNPISKQLTNHYLSNNSIQAENNFVNNFISIEIGFNG
jgi:hypothetical protein